jgi:hypothetical protein
MKKSFFFIYASLALFFSAVSLEAAQTLGGFGSSSSGIMGGMFGSSGPQKKPKVVMKPAVRYAIENFDIGIGYKNGTPNVVSTLDWKNIHVMGGGLSGEAEAMGIPVIYEVFYGVLRKKGKMVDRDYSGSNKTLMWSESQSKVVGSALDGSVGAAFLDVDQFRALAGAFYTSRDYEMRDTKQTVSSQANYNIFPNDGANVPAVGTIYSGKRGTYKMKIYGPWVGGDMNLEISSSVKGQGLLKLMYGWFKGNGKWPSHSFRDSSNTYGGEAKVGVTAQLTQTFNMSADIGMKYFKIKRGSAKTNQQTLGDYFRGGTFKSYSAALGGTVKL